MSEEETPAAPPQPAPDDVDALNALLMRRRAALAVAPTSSAPPAEDAEVQRANAALLMRRRAGLGLPEPVSLGEEVRRLTERLVEEIGEAESKRREARWARRVASQRVASTRAAAKLRDVPAGDVLAAALDESPRLTAALRVVLGACRWRARVLAESGRRPAHTLVLGGGNGNGKTAAASWLCVRYPGTALFVPAGRIGDDQAPRERIAFLREACRTVGLLVIDDVGSDTDEWVRRGVVGRLGPLLFHRHNEGLATILTTNLPSKTFFEQYVGAGEPVVGRAGEGEEEQPAKGPAARLASRLRDQRRLGANYWAALQNADDYRTAEGRAKLEALPRLDPREWDALAEKL